MTALTKRLTAPCNQAGAVVLLICLFSSISAAAPVEPLFKVTPPAGFGDVLEEELTFIDVYYLGKKIGRTLASYDNETLVFEDPAGLVDFIPELRDRQTVENSLTQPLKHNRQLQCKSGESDQGTCARLETDTAGIVFYPQDLKAQLFINARYRYGRDNKARYLPPPSRSAGAILSFSSRGIYDTNEGTSSGASQINFITGLGRLSFSSDIFAQWSQTTQLRDAQFIYSGRDSQISAGFLPFASNSSLAQPARLLGIRHATSLNTRIDKNALLSSEVSIQTAGSAVVEILRDGVVLDIQRVQQGTSLLNTQRLPYGSYNLQLRITENGVIREESRFYTKSLTLPPIGTALWHWSIGSPVAHTINQQLIPEQQDSLILELGYNKRLSARFAARATISASDVDRYAEVGLQYQSSIFSTGISLLRSADQDSGFSLQAGLRQNNWSLSFHARQIDAAQTQNQPADSLYDPFPRSYRQGGIVAGLRFNRLRMAVRGFYRKSESLPEVYYAGPTIDWDISKKRNARLALFSRVELGNQGSSVYAGVRWHTTGKLDISGTTSLTYRENKNTDLRTSNSVVETHIKQTLTDTARFQNQLNVGFRHENDLYQDDSNLHPSESKTESGVRASLQSQTPWADLALDATNGYQRSDNIIGSLNTSLVIGGSKAAIVANPGEGGVFMEIRGNSSSDFSLLSNGVARKRVANSGSTYVPLSSFEIQDIRIRPVSGDNTEYEHHEDRIVTYPGNISTLTRSANTVVIAVGQLVGENNKAIVNAPIYAGELLGFTDDQGYFQFDLSNQKTLKVIIDDERSCRADIERENSNTREFVNLGLIHCSL